MNIGTNTPLTEFMRNMLRPRNTPTGHDVMRLPGEVQAAAAVPHGQRGAADIGKVNMILIGLLVVILFGLLTKEEGSASFSNQATRAQTQMVAEATPAAAVETAVLAEEERAVAYETPPEPSKPEPKVAPKKAKKMIVAEQASAAGHAPAPVVEHTVTPLQTVIDESAQKNPSTKILVFNIWSVSELRLRSTYATFMNDSDVPAPQLESRKKDYLSFVNRRTRKCGELDNKFASNINSVEKLSFSKGDVETLECHAEENNAELDKLNALSAHGA